MDIRTSPLVEMAGEAERPTRWWLAWLVAIGLVFIGLPIGDVIGQAVLGDPGKSEPLHQFGEVFSFSFSVALLFLWLRLKERRHFSSVGLRGPNPLGRLLLGLVIGAAMMSAGVLVLWASGQYVTGASQHAKVGGDAIAVLVPLLLVFIIQGSIEEVFTRGYMLPVAGRQTSAMVAIIGSSVVFAVIHLEFRPLPLLNIVLYAVFACFVALGDGSLWVICGIHAGWNFFQGNVFGLPVSGNGEPTALWDLGPARGAREIVTGGDFGVEASVVGTVVLTVALIIAAARYRRIEAARHQQLPAVPDPDPVT